jgi:hypothetical protein
MLLGDQKLSTVKNRGFYPGWVDEAGRLAGLAERRTYGTRSFQDLPNGGGRREKSDQQRVRRLQIDGQFENGSLGVDVALKAE